MSKYDDHGTDEGTSIFSTVSPKSAPGKRKAEPDKTWFGRHRALVALLMIGTVLLASCGGWAVYLNNQISGVDRFAIDLDENRRPKKATGEAAKAVNILMAGADAGPGPTIAEMVASGEWEPYSHRSDTIMVLHVTADREHAYLISVPRDSYVDIEGIGKSKINAAFATGGPSLYLQTMEDLTGLRMDHLAIIDWDGFKDLTTALGGVEVFIPETIEDTSQGVTWDAGTHDLEGKEALQYVRTRYGLANGDFDRIKRQQNFLRATMGQLLSQGTMSNPIKLTNSLEAITSNLTVDNDFTNAEIRDLALSLRGMSTKDVTFITIPTECCPNVDGQSTVRVKKQQTKELFQAVSQDSIEVYLDEHSADLLGDEKSVS